MAAAAGGGGGGGEFSNVWTLAQAASRDPFHLGQFLEIVWENTSGYLLVACLVSLAAALLSWVYVVRAEPPHGPDHQTGTRSAAERTARTSLKSNPATDDADAGSDAASAGDDAPDDASDDTSDDNPAGPPLPPASEDEEDSFEDRQGGVPDLVEMAHHLPARVKQAELRHIREKLQGDMTEEQQVQEREVERDQMAAILELMQQNSDKFGRPSQDDMQAQLKLYM